MRRHSRGRQPIAWIQVSVSTCSTWQSGNGRVEAFLFQFIYFTVLGTKTWKGPTLLPSVVTFCKSTSSEQALGAQIQHEQENKKIQECTTAQQLDRQERRALGPGLILGIAKISGVSPGDAFSAFTSPFTRHKQHCSAWVIQHRKGCGELTECDWMMVAMSKGNQQATRSSSTGRIRTDLDFCWGFTYRNILNFQSWWQPDTTLHSLTPQRSRPLAKKILHSETPGISDPQLAGEVYHVQPGTQIHVSISICIFNANLSPILPLPGAFLLQVLAKKLRKARAEMHSQGLLSQLSVLCHLNDLPCWVIPLPLSRSASWQNSHRNQPPVSAGELHTVFKPPGTKLFKRCHCAGFETKAAPQKEARVNSSSIIWSTDKEGGAALKVREIITWLMRHHGWQEMPSSMPQGLMQRDMFIDWAFSSSAPSCFIIYLSALRLMEKSWGTLKSGGAFCGGNIIFNLDPTLETLHILLGRCPQSQQQARQVTAQTGELCVLQHQPSSHADCLHISEIADKMKPTRDHLVTAMTKTTLTVKTFS